jgi:hypothetical protein
MEMSQGLGAEGIYLFLHGHTLSRSHHHPLKPFSQTSSNLCLNPSEADIPHLTTSPNIQQVPLYPQSHIMTCSVQPVQSTLVKKSADQ